MENKKAVLKKLTSNVLKEILKSNSIKEYPKLVFINSCHSEGVARVFLNAGVPVVICVD